jgi:hypothetical protein
MSEGQQEPAAQSIWSRPDLAFHSEHFKNNDIFTKIAVSVTLQRKKYADAQKRVREDLQLLWGAFQPEQHSAINLTVKKSTGETLETWLKEWDPPPGIAPPQL